MDAISQDSTILAGLLAGAPDRAKYKILPDQLSREEIGIGVAKNQPALLAKVNEILLALEKDGQAVKIYNTWFGPGSKFATPVTSPSPRSENNMTGGASPLIEFRDVHKWHGSLHVIKGINLSVNRGEALAIIGPSGSGKSTLIRLANRLETISKGEILIDGVPTSGFTGRLLRELRTEIGFVFQQFNLYGHLSALDNVSLALRKVRGVPRRKAEARGARPASPRRIG